LDPHVFRFKLEAAAKLLPEEKELVAKAESTVK
jgi:hypothetical protein